MVIIIGLHGALGLMGVAVARNGRNLDTEAFKEKCGTITEGVDVKNIVGRYWNVIVLMRWSGTIIILVCLRATPEYQIILLLIVSVIFQCLSIRFKPLEEPIENRISLFNESMVSIYLYIMLGLTDFNSVNPSR